MGITARGGESVKLHFREMGKNIQSEDFTVVGIGDMAGDVFGNGMLLSKHKTNSSLQSYAYFCRPNSSNKLERTKTTFSTTRKQLGPI